jgi:subtilase family serine protease
MNRIVRVASLLASAVVMASCGHGAASAVPIGAMSRARMEAIAQPVCAPMPTGFARCLSLMRTDAFAEAFPEDAGYGPSDLQSAYKLPSATAGTGQTVGVVDAFDDPTAESDLRLYRSHFGLPDCTTANGCFMKVNQRGRPSPLPKANSGWAAEISLDLDMVSAVCPNCHILLVEADDDGATNLGMSVDTAASLGANVIGTSFGSTETGSKALEKYFHHPGHMITAAIGDGGYGISFPASSPDVTAVGGTTLTRANNGRGWTETIWSSVDPLCSAVYARPLWQMHTGCAKRASGDVGAVADPSTGVAVVYQGRFVVIGGTSVSSQIIAGVYALAGNASTLHYGSYSYSHLGDLFGVRGAARDCEAACRDSQGYDGSTGNGTPNGTGAF